MPEHLTTSRAPFLTEARREAITTLAEEITGGNSVQRVLVFGPPGVGKTSVLITAARLLHGYDNDIVYCGTHSRPSRPYGSILAAVPELDSILSSVLDNHIHTGTAADTGADTDTDTDGPGPRNPSAEMIASWHRAGLALQDLDPVRHSVLIIDDVQLLDEYSAAFIEFLESSPSSRRIALILAAIDPDELTVPLRRSLLRTDARYLMLDPMDQYEVADLVVQYFRDSTAPARRALAADLIRRSEGLPAVIEALLPMVNPATYTIDDPEPPDFDAVESSIASANRFVNEGSHREAVERLTALNRIEGLKLNTETRRLLATSLYQMGVIAEADRVRVDLVREALTSGDHLDAFASSMIGQPNAEAIDGDLDRLNGLLGIHDERLPPTVRQQHATATFREALYAGHIDVAHYWKQRSEQLAESVDQQAAAAHVAWHLATLTKLPVERKQRLDEVIQLDGLSPGWRALLHELRAIDHYEAGQMEQAVADYEVLGDHAELVNDPLRTWHHLMFQTTILFDAGNWERAEEVRTEAMVFAVEHAIMGGEGLYIAQHFHRSWILGQHAELVGMFPNLPPEIGKTRFGIAGLAETLRAAGQIDEAVEIGKPLVEELLDEPRYSRIGLVAFLARFIVETCSAATVERAVELLSWRTGTAVMLGAGMSSLGPADRALFQLTGEIEHLEHAIAFADQAKLLLWQVLLRVEHPNYEQSGSGMLSRQATNLAAGTDLEVLLSLPR